nr:hypothetical protein [uncultured Desulfobacter sp.]
MDKKKKNRKKKNKLESQFVIRITAAQRERFILLCEEMDTSAAREIRKFIRQFLAEHEPKKD